MDVFETRANALSIASGFAPVQRRVIDGVVLETDIGGRLIGVDRRRRAERDVHDRDRRQEAEAGEQAAVRVVDVADRTTDWILLSSDVGIVGDERASRSATTAPPCE